MNLPSSNTPIDLSKLVTADIVPQISTPTLDTVKEVEYAVSLKRGVDYDQFWYEIENLSDADRFVPSRRIDIVNNRDGSTRICHYALTEAEATFLRNDPRVNAVEIPPDQRKDITIGLNARQTGNFDKPASSAGSELNWGLIRCINRSNGYGTGTSISENYRYLLDGSGVDVVIQDSGIEVNHPEFKDYAGNNRIQQIDWFTASGVSGTQNANHYRDYDGHGTHVAAIAAGLNYGWAKNARIYSQKISGLEGSGDSGTGISTASAFDCIRLWHRNKPIDPRTGFKRPTVVNMSWGYFLGNSNWSLANIDTYLLYMKFRGATYDINAQASALGATTWQIRWLLGQMPSYTGSYFKFPNRVATTDTEIQEMIDEGIHICIAAGNDSNKIDVSGGTDYDNEFYWDGDGTTAQGWYKYHRGSSPYDDQAIIVGAMDNTTYSASEERKAGFSATGPGVDLYAPGNAIKSACSNTNTKSGVTYYNDSSFKQVNLGGTSQASPQVAGILALYLQMNPGVSVTNAKNWLINKCTASVMHDTGSNSDWSANGYVDNVSDHAYFSSLKGGSNRLLFSPFGQEEDQITQGSITFNNITVTTT